MKMTSNVHTHSTYCDGANTLREMAEHALSLGFTDLGFSSHSPTPFDPDFPGIVDEQVYRSEIAALKEEYCGRLGILCGVEQEAYRPVNREDYDYIIGSVHYMPFDDGAMIPNDNSRTLVDVAARKYYRGDCLAMARDYYSMVVSSTQRDKPDIIGHFDLITKFNGDNSLFDENGKTYRDMALEALDAVIDTVVPYGGMIEVNTSVMVRKLRNNPYPAPFLMRRMVQRNVRAIITSDSHQASTLNTGFDAALEIMRDVGFRSMALLKNGAFVDVNI